MAAVKLQNNGSGRWAYVIGSIPGDPAGLDPWLQTTTLSQYAAVFDIVHLAPSANLGLQSRYTGKFVSADRGLPGNQLIANRDQLLEWETFSLEILARSEGRALVAIKSSNGLYVSAITPHAQFLRAEAQSVGANEQWWWHIQDD